MKLATISVIGFACLLGACSSEAPPLPPVSAAAQPAPVQTTVFDAQFKALDKAKAEQGVINQQKADADKKLEDAGG